MRIFLSLLLLAACTVGHSQCTVAIGLPPPDTYFNTASDGNANTIPPGTADKHWKVAKDSINGDYQPAVMMSTVPPVYYSSNLKDCSWISFSPTGEHSSNRFFFFRIDFDLPCFSPCGKRYDSANTFCINLDLFADNSIYEIYVNGVAQSGNMGNRIPLADPYHAEGAKEGNKVNASLCRNWRSGNNSLVIKIASSATVAALLVQAAVTPLPPIQQQKQAVICEGSNYNYGNKNLTSTGLYLDTFKTATGCDSVVALNLVVKPRPHTTFDTSICEGAGFNGHTNAGSYTDTFKATNGCDSLVTVRLSIRKKPMPGLGMGHQLCTGDSLILFPGAFNTYSWQDGSANNKFIVKSPGTYSVTVTDDCGTGMAQTVVTEKTCDLVFPSAFTPNRDGLNDVFKILGNTALDEYELLIFNRWGQKIFEAHDPAKGWDGNVNGQMQPQGTFIWICRYKKNNVITNLKGSFILIR